MNRKERLRKALQFSTIEFEPAKADLYDVHGCAGLDGHRDKMFYRIESSKFNHLIEDVTFNENCSYITHVNSVLEDGVIPSRISALRKTINATHYRQTKSAEMLLYAEVLSSRLLEYFGCPTVYNEAVAYNIEERQSIYEVVSVDFLEYGQEFYSFFDLACDFDDNLENCVRQIRYELGTDKFSYYSQSEKDRVVEDFVYSYFIRRNILRDVDFGHNNCGIIEDQERGKLQYINYDFEYSMGSRRPRGKENLVYCSREFPHIFSRIFERVSEFRENFLELAGEFAIDFDNFFHREMVEELYYSVESTYWMMWKMGCTRVKR